MIKLKDGSFTPVAPFSGEILTRFKEFVEHGEALRVGSGKMVAEAINKTTENAAAENARLGKLFDDLAYAIGWSKERCEQAGDSPLDVARQLMSENASLKEQIETRSCGCGEAICKAARRGE